MRRVSLKERLFIYYRGEALYSVFYSVFAPVLTLAYLLKKKKYASD